MSTSSPGFLTYASPVPLSKVSMTAAGSGTVTWYASPDNADYQEIQAVKNGDDYTVSSLPAGTRYVKFSIPGSSAVQIDKVQLEYVYTGSDFAEVPPLQRNGFIVDNSFTSLDAGKSSNLQIVAGQSGTEGLSTLGRSDSNAAELVYKTDGDMNSYRFTAYSNVNDEIKFYASIDGDTYAEVHPAVSKSATADGWSKLIYSDFALPASTRYMKAVYPAAGSGAAPALARAEIGYGVNMIPLTDKAPANVFEDGEYDYGLDENLKVQYNRNTNGDDISISLDSTNKNQGSYGVKVDYAFSSQWYTGLTKQLAHVNLAGFDALHAWVKPDGSSNALAFQFKTADNRVWEAKKVLSGTTGSTIELKYSDFVQPQWNIDAYGAASINMSDVIEFSIYVSSVNGATANAGSIYLDDIKMANASKLDNFEGYGGYDALVQKAFSRNSGGGSFDVSLDKTHKSEGNFGFKIDYNFAGPGYAGGSFNPDFLNLTGYDGFSFWLQPDGSNNELAIQFTDASGKYWETKAVIQGTDPRIMLVPFDSFRYPSWYSSDTSARPNSSTNITAVSFYMGGSENSVSSSGTLYMDDIHGAKFTSDLQTAEVSINPASSAVTTLPYTISGTAKNSKYVSIQVGKQKFYAPVQPDGTWTYATSKLANGTKEVKAAIELFDGTVVTSAEQTLEVNVPNNPYNDGETPAQTNYLMNASFDEAVDETAWPILPKAWINKGASGEDVTNGIVKLEASNHRTGTYGLIHWNDTPYEVTTSQEVQNLPDGRYEVRAWTKSKGGQEAAEMIATVEGQEPQKVNLPVGTGTWSYIKISDLEVRGGKLTVAFHSKDQGDHWIAVEDVELVKTGDVPDTMKPVITLNGDAQVEVEYGASYQDAGAAAADEQDGDLTAHIVVTGTVNTSVPGVYTLHYNVTDAAGNAAEEVIRTVTVKPATGKPYLIEPVGAVDRAGGLSASVHVSRAAGGADHAGDEVVYFQLMKGDTPISYVALSKDIESSEQLAAYFDVSDPANTQYSLYVFVLDTLTKDISTLPNSLSVKTVIH
ncbi:immunoglobulin-like domain-containing protein [Paenibacillus hexagrammi]|uniref:DUF5011 domain-containing protein n=1 Tax=Paenibacillus hexagrammi TaxID=2908839 RepID=A0ABY3SEX7_9BACL|nr:immunoglobulin-like domain-containing protein [Paenibacillus sp. YPD9-1]UJF31794.1 DUF5011 domain-containing protein [Paenibacillus sp. YPD9-1]